MSSNPTPDSPPLMPSTDHAGRSMRKDRAPRPISPASPVASSGINTKHD